MTQRQLKETLRKLVVTYFDDCAVNVSWGKTKKVAAPEPSVVLSMGSVTRHYHAINLNIDGVPVDCYPSSTTLQVDLYTAGSKVVDEDGFTGANENTAVNDLTEFLNFLNSEYANEWTAEQDISVLCNRVDDLSELINDTSWSYRAMAELEVGFTQTSVGRTGMMHSGGVPYYDAGVPKYTDDGMPLYVNGSPMYDGEGEALGEDGAIIDGDSMGLPPIEPDGKPPKYKPSPSGGGTQELADEPAYWIEQVEINKRRY